jgi:tRNA(fMet)-specific endonuclease VapC
MLLLDTDVMIDLMRNYQPATAWLDELGMEALALPGVVAMELIQGCRDKTEQRRVEVVLQSYPIYWPPPSECADLYETFARYRLSHGVEILDTLIAATAVGLNAPLATFNGKHYRVFPQLQFFEPYRRL